MFDRNVPTYRGYSTIFRVKEGTKEVVGPFVFQRNTVMNGSADVLARLMGGNAAYNIGYMYMEFENLATPESDPSVPTYTKDEGLEYYTGLNSSLTTDFLRVPILVTPGISTTDEDYAGNMVTFTAITTGDLTGFWGREFSEAANSVIYGGALVSAPIPAAPTNDIIVCRNYPAGAKVPKVSGEQVCMVWSVEFAAPAAAESGSGS